MSKTTEKTVNETVQIRVFSAAYNKAMKINAKQRLKSAKPISLQETVSNLIMNTDL